MKHLLIIFSVFLFSQRIHAQQYASYRVTLSTWDKVKVTGMITSINDSVIVVESTGVLDKGKTYPFSAEKVRNLKIWKKGFNLPFALVGAAAVGFLGASITENDNGKVAGITTGSIVGALVGLSTSNALFTRYNKRKLHLSNFKKVIHQL